MTAIVAIKRKNIVVMAGDSAAVDASSGRLYAVNRPKVFSRTGGYMFGYCGSFRTGQLIEHTLDLPIIDEHKDIQEQMVNKFIPSLKKCLSDGGATGSSDSPFFLVSIHGRIFTVESDYQCREDTSHFSAVGAGMHYALGAMNALKKDEDPVKVAFEALRAAAKFNAFVIPPFFAITDEGKKFSTKK